MKTYFIWDQNIYVKIGKAINPERRLKILQCGNCTPLKLLLVLEGDREAELHQRFARQRGFGEWFFFADEIEQFIADERAR